MEVFPIYERKVTEELFLIYFCYTIDFVKIKSVIQQITKVLSKEKWFANNYILMFWRNTTLSAIAKYECTMALPQQN